MKNKPTNRTLFQISFCLLFCVFTIVAQAKKHDWQKKHHSHFEWIKVKKTLPIATNIKILKFKKELDKVASLQIPTQKNDSIFFNNSPSICKNDLKNEEQISSIKSSLSSIESIQQKKLLRKIILLKKISSLKTKINQKIFPTKESEHHPHDPELEKKYGLLSLIFGIIGIVLYPTIIFSVLAIYFGRKANSDLFGRVGFVLGIVGLIFLLLALLIFAWLMLAFI